jgi:manganese/iron transport system permease protein
VHAFDPQHARAIGLPVRLLHYGLLALVSLTVVAALQAVGIILAIAVLIAPGATAFLWVRRFGPMLAVSTAVALTAALLGVYASFWLDSAPAPTIVLVLTLLFGASLAATRLRPAARRAA